MPLHVEVVSPERILYSGDAEMVIARTTEGEVAFQPGHAAFIGQLVVEVVRILDTADGDEAVAVHGGFVEVADDRVTVLSDSAELVREIDLEVARRELEEAERHALDVDDAEIEARLARARLRFRLAGG